MRARTFPWGTGPRQAPVLPGWEKQFVPCLVLSPGKAPAPFHKDASPSYPRWACPAWDRWSRLGASTQGGPWALPAPCQLSLALPQLSPR